MLTIEQKQRKELLERYNKARATHTMETIANAYGCTKQNILSLIQKLKADGTTPKGIRKLTQALNKLEGERDE